MTAKRGDDPIDHDRIYGKWRMVDLERMNASFIKAVTAALGAGSANLSQSRRGPLRLRGAERVL
jgi:hypothetical protein